MGPEIFSLNVGGRKFTTSRETVCKVWREPSSPLEIASRSTYTRWLSLCYPVKQSEANIQADEAPIEEKYKASVLVTKPAGRCGSLGPSAARSSVCESMGLYEIEYRHCGLYWSIGIVLPMRV